MLLDKHTCVVHHGEETVDRIFFDADAAPVVIARIFLIALGSLKMWRGTDHRCGALGVTVY